jgi:uncharacterized damage-inducible protein DinB
MLAWHDAHVEFEGAIAGIPKSKRGQSPPGLPYSPWQLLEHLRLAQKDILEFCRNPKYVEMHWPDDYWPKDPAPPDAKAWDASVASFKRDREKMKHVARETKDLYSSVPTGDETQTYLRALLLVTDHNAYHLGQLVAVRRALGEWT